MKAFNKKRKTIEPKPLPKGLMDPSKMKLKINNMFPVTTDLKPV